MPAIEAPATSGTRPASEHVTQPLGLSGLAGLAATLAASQVVSSVLNLARAKSVAIYLGPVGIGTVSVVDQLSQVVAFAASLALPYASVKYLSRAHSEGPTSFAQAYSLFVQTVLVTTTCVAMLASVATLAWPQVWGQHLVPHANLIALALLTVPVMALHGLQLNVFAALQRPRLASLAGLGGTAVTTVGAVSGMLAGGLLGLYAGTLLASVLVAGAILAFLWRRYDLRLPGAGWLAWGEWRQYTDVLRFCGMTYVISVGHPVSFFLARYALLRSMGLAEVGFFQSAYALAGSIALLLGQSNAYYLTPLLNRSTPPHEKVQQAFGFQRHLALGATVAALPLALFPQLWLTVLFSDAFTAAAPYLALFALGQVVLLLAGALQALLIGLDDLWAHLMINLGAQATLAALAWLLTPMFGVWGVAIAFLAAQCSVFLACAGRLQLRHGARLPARSVVVIAYGVILVTVAGWLGQGELVTTGDVAFRLLILIVGVASLCSLLTADEWRILRTVRLRSRFLSSHR